MRAAFKCLLKLYPGEYRTSFAAEMMATFEESTEERRGFGRIAFARFALEEMTGVIAGAAREWIGRISNIARTSNNIAHSDRSSSAEAARSLLEKMRTPWVSREMFFKVADLICDAGVCANAPQNALPDAVIQAQERVRFLIGRMAHAISNCEFERVRFYSNEERKERENLRLLLEQFKIV